MIPRFRESPLVFRSQLADLVRVLAFVIVTAFAFAVVLSSCTKQQASTAIKTTVKVADTVCSIVGEDAAAPDWAVLACQAEGIAAPVAVMLPRKALSAIHVAADAGADR